MSRGGISLTAVYFNQAASQTAGHSDHLESIVVLRGVAALAVAFFHFTHFATSPLRSIGVYGTLGVPMFFVISGFVILLSLARSDFRSLRDAPIFLSRRLLRLEPAYLCTVFLTVALLFLAAPINGLSVSDSVLKSVPWHLAYLVPWTSYDWINPVFWSLAIEFQFYLAVLLLAPQLLFRDAWRMRGTLAIVALLSLVSSDYRLVVFHLPLFGIGIVGALFYVGRLGRAETVAWILVFVLGGSINFTWLPLAVGVVTCIAFFVPLRTSLPILSAAGVMSYSIYLLHVPIGVKVIYLLGRLPNSTVAHIATLTAAFSVTFAASYVMWRWLERPSLLLAKSIQYRPRTTQAGAAS